MRAIRRDQRGQAAVELVAVLPFLALLAALAAQLAIVGYGLWTSASAARAGARAELVGGDAEAAARSAVPTALRRGIEVTEEPVAVRLEVPSLLPGRERIAVSASSALDDR